MKAGKIAKLTWYLEILPKLGVGNVLYVLFYRMRLKSGYFKRKNRVNKWVGEGTVFSGCSRDDRFPEEWEKSLLEQADRILGGSLPYFSHHWIKQSDPPHWFLNPFNGQLCQESARHWSKIPDFNPDLGDIKCLWEASRFSWLGILARAYVVSGKDIYLDRLNSWLDDWIRKNPLNQGPNWKCGQETSFRVLALLNAANILDQTDRPSERLVEMIALHLGRISPNIRYAFAQRNNHASSEAAALYIAGNWLLRVNAPRRKHNLGYAKKGRRALEKLVRSLCYEDGSFSQHSVVYHRLFLDTLSQVLFWTGKMGLPAFALDFYRRAELVYDWLFALVDESGDCPNLGPNDGTLLQNNHSCDYRDFRPALQVASVLLKDRPVFKEGPYNEALHWYGLRARAWEGEPGEKTSRLFQSGYVVMHGRNSWAMLRFPFFKFRPSHNDAMHFDLWAGGENLLFDSGSYSYNPPPESAVPDLKSVHSHNTLSFDQSEQMPRLGRFLLAKWLKPRQVGAIILSEERAGSWAGSYKDAAGNIHERGVRWSKNRWELQDSFSGTAAHVEIGFNFLASRYTLDEAVNRLVLPWGSVKVSENAEISVATHMLSRYYYQAEACSRLLITTRNNAEIIITIEIN